MTGSLSLSLSLTCAGRTHTHTQRETNASKQLENLTPSLVARIISHLALREQSLMSCTSCFGSRCACYSCYRCCYSRYCSSFALCPLFPSLSTLSPNILHKMSVVKEREREQGLFRLNRVFLEKSHGMFLELDARECCMFSCCALVHLEADLLSCFHG